MDQVVRAVQAAQVALLKSEVGGLLRLGPLQHLGALVESGDLRLRETPRERECVFARAAAQVDDAVVGLIGDQGVQVADGGAAGLAEEVVLVGVPRHGLSVGGALCGMCVPQW